MRPIPRLVVGLATVALLVAFAPSARANGIVVEAVPEGADATTWTSGRSPVALTGHVVSVDVKGRIAAVVVEQTFRNASAMRLEGIYLFPLPEGAVVSNFAMSMGGKMVEGQVLDAIEARRIYDGIVRRRRDPGLLEYAGRGLYRASVFPIEPHGDVKVRLAFQQALLGGSEAVELRYPLATDRMNAAPVANVSVEVRIESDRPIRSLYSPSHPVAATRDGDKKAVVRWAQENTVQDRDFHLYLGPGDGAVGLVLDSDKPGADDGTFFAVLSPRVTVPEGERQPKDLVFVLDTSGSMEGTKLEHARTAILAGIERLRPIDRFNVIEFSTAVRPWSETLVSPGAIALASVRAWLDTRVARGGTNIDGALSSALETRSDGRLLLVVFVTDGLPTIGEQAPDAIVGRVGRHNPSKARVFTFGVGHDLDVALLDRIAEATGGARDYVARGGELELVASRFYTKVEEPVLTDVSVDFGRGVREVYPPRIPDLFAGGQVVVFGRYAQAGDRTVRLTGRLYGAPVSFELPGTLREGAGPGPLARLWAERKIAYLLDEMRLHRRSKELIDEVISLGTKYAIVTPYTSYLVAEDSEFAGPRPRTAPSPGAGGSRRGGSQPPGGREPTDAPPHPTAPSPTAPTPTTPSSPPYGPYPNPTTPQPMSPDPVTSSEELKRRKERDTPDGRDSKARAVRLVAGRTFVRQRDGRWVDTAWDRKGAPTRVELLSDAWLVLLAKGGDVARILALGDRIVFVESGTAYEVVPAPPSAPAK